MLKTLPNFKPLSFFNFDSENIYYLTVCHYAHVWSINPQGNGRNQTVKTVRKSADFKQSM